MVLLGEPSLLIPLLDHLWSIEHHPFHIRPKTTHREFDTTFPLKTLRHYIYESSDLYVVQPSLFQPKWISIFHLKHQQGTAKLLSQSNPHKIFALYFPMI